ncbi:hypothetical protein [Trinickia acidisoli]|uniref:hypothetical protein n=1 Tax=Trinickia acidisoli TaxID=2767482 RepID=UPI001A9028BB|nr:hypothetical protein [Trinickia acidisoli]
MNTTSRGFLQGASFASPELPASLALQCANCIHGDHDPASIERAIAGLVAFGSAYGSSIADSLLCMVLDRFVSPGDCCSDFAPKQAGRQV